MKRPVSGAPPKPKRIYEIDGRDRALLGLTLGLGVLLADLLLAAWKGWPGLSVTVLVLAWEGVMFWYGRGSGKRRSRPGLWLTAAVILLALTFAIFSNRWFYCLNLCALPCLMTVQMFELFGGTKQAWWQPMMLCERALLLLEGLFCQWGAPIRALGGAKKESEGRKRLAYVLLGLLLGAAVLMLVLPLLKSADAVFNQMVSGIEYYLSKHFGALVWRLVLGALAVPFFFSLFYALRRPSDSKAMGALGEIPRGEGLDPALSVTALAVLDGVYLLFVGVQSAALFGGPAYLARMGMSYAEYARSGFFQMVWVSCINLAVVVAAVHFSRREGRLWQVLRVLSTLMVALSGVILASAAWRMTMYVGSYGLSFKRLLTYWGMVMLVIFFVGALLKIWKRQFGFFRVLFAASIAGWLVLNFVNVDAIVAEYNVRAYLSGNATMDLPYLAGLSYDTLPALERLPGEMWAYHGYEYSLSSLIEDRREMAAWETSCWETWNLSAWMAAQG